MSETTPQIDDVGRPEPPMSADELGTLLGFLDFQRATLEWKCRGLTGEQLNLSIAPTSMTLGGILKHMAYVEDFWFAEVVAEQPTGEPWASVDWNADSDWEWSTARDHDGDELRALWSARVANSRSVVQQQLAGGVDAGLAATHPAWGGRAEVSLRWVLVHMIEEYARHNGHADLLRESIDGETGE